MGGAWERGLGAGLVAVINAALVGAITPCVYELLEGASGIKLAPLHNSYHAATPVHSRMEVAVQPSTRVPMFSEAAQTIQVETLDGLACTHQARRTVH